MTELFFVSFFSTFILEDLALAASIALVSQHKLTLGMAFSACFLGIMLGDFGLYGLGALAQKIERWSAQSQTPEIRLKLNLVLQAVSKRKPKVRNASTIVLSRFLPGARLPIYFAAGFSNYSFFSFAVLIFCSVFSWVAIAFAGGEALIKLTRDHWLILFLCVFLFFNFVKWTIPQFLDPWKRKAFRHSWRRITRFEFWPGWFFYIPVVIYYFYLAIRFRALFAPMDSNPHILFGGFVGESKWDFYEHILGDPKSLQSYYFDKFETPEEGAEAISKKMLEVNLLFPVILKPDVGQRGFAVRIINHADELLAYLQTANFSILLQEYSLFPNEAGVFYYKNPGDQSGHIFSITTKCFPIVVGDGKSKLAELILKDPRARIIANIYFERLQSQLSTIIPIGTVIRLTECGNHCQGAVFLNGDHLKSEGLLESIDQLASQIPEFYVGRLDIRFKNDEQLRKGLDYEVIEINGAGSEATHIWDPKTNLINAYQSLFEQWRIVFRIGLAVRSHGKCRSPRNSLLLIKTIFQLSRRKHALSRSS